jgi:hypothetical protein
VKRMALETTHLDRQQVLALRGLRLPQKALQSLRAYGILCEPSVSIYWQKAADHYLIRARESGGAVREIGAYCGFASDPEDPPSWTEPFEPLTRNGLHVLVLAPTLVRVHVFRYRQTYDLLITRHRLTGRPARKRPLLENTVLFHGVRGAFPQGEPAGEVLPLFDDGFGNPARVPESLREIANGAIVGADCIGCNHSHLSVSCKIA